MGGEVALKGTDGIQMLKKALALGAQAEAENKTSAALAQLRHLEEKPLVLTVSGSMGENVCERLGLPYQIIASCSTATSPHDTVSAGKEEQINRMFFQYLCCADSIVR